MAASKLKSVAKLLGEGKLREDAEFDKRDRSSQVEVHSLIRPSRSRWTTSTKNSSPVSTRSTSRAWSPSVIS